MGAVRVGKRILAAACVAAALLPAQGAHAATQTVAPPYLTGPSGGDQYNYVNQDDSTGTLTVLRYSVNGPSSGLGCGGSGGYANFEVDATVPDSLQSVTVHYTTPAVDPYTWIDVAVRQDGHFIGSQQDRGIIVQDGATTATVSGVHAGPVQVWFGLQTSSACPNIDGGRAVFSSVDFNS